MALVSVENLCPGLFIIFVSSYRYLYVGTLGTFFNMLVCQQYTWMTCKKKLVSTLMTKQMLQYAALQVSAYTKYSSYAEVFYQKTQIVLGERTVLKKQQRLH